MQLAGRREASLSTSACIEALGGREDRGCARGGGASAASRPGWDPGAPPPGRHDAQPHRRLHQEERRADVRCSAVRHPATPARARPRRARALRSSPIGAARRAARPRCHRAKPPPSRRPSPPRAGRRPTGGDPRTATPPTASNRTADRIVGRARRLTTGDVPGTSLRPGRGARLSDPLGPPPSGRASGRPGGARGARHGARAPGWRAG
jgi:hypothetical protein